MACGHRCHIVSERFGEAVVYLVEVCGRITEYLYALGMVEAELAQALVIELIHLLALCSYLDPMALREP